jgi:hypothetical protein
MLEKETESIRNDHLEWKAVCCRFPDLKSELLQFVERSARRREKSVGASDVVRNKKAHTFGDEWSADTSAASRLRTYDHEFESPETAAQETKQSAGKQCREHLCSFSRVVQYRMGELNSQY